MAMVMASLPQGVFVVAIVAISPNVVIVITIWQHGRMAHPTNLQFAVVVHVLAYLAGAGGERAVSSDELAGSTNANPVYLRRALGPLREAGLVRSRPGVGGGGVLARPAADIGLDEVWRIVHGDDHVLGLHGANPTCPVGVSIAESLVRLDRDVATAVEAELARTTVADLLAGADWAPLEI